MACLEHNLMCLNMKKVYNSWFWASFVITLLVGFFVASKFSDCNRLDFEKLAKESVKKLNKEGLGQTPIGKVVKAEYNDKFCEMTIVVGDENLKFLDLETQCSPRMSALNIMTPIAKALAKKYTIAKISKAVSESGVGYKYIYLDKNRNLLKTVTVPNRDLVEAVPYVIASPKDSYFSKEFIVNYITESVNVLLPMRLDEYTILKEVVATQEGPLYLYELEGILIDDLSEEGIENIWRSVVAEWQTNPLMVPFFKEMAKTDLVITYRYFNPEGEKLFGFIVTPNEILTRE